MGEAPDATTLVQDVAEAEALDLPADTRVAYITQTTLSVDETAEIIGVLRRRFPELRGPKKEDICYATSNRQWAVKEMLARDRAAARDRLTELVQLEPARRRRARRRRSRAPDRRRDRDRRALARRCRHRRGDVGGVRAREARDPGLRLVPRARSGGSRRVPDGRRGRHVPAPGRVATGARAVDR